MSPSDRTYLRMHAVSRRRSLSISARSMNRSIRKLVLEPLERRCVMDAALGDWLMPLGIIEPAPVTSGDTSPALTDGLFDSIKQSPILTTPIPSPQITDEPLSNPEPPSIPYGPQVPWEIDPPIDAPGLDSGEQTTGPLIQNPLDPPSDLGTSEVDKSTTPDRLPSELESPTAEVPGAEGPGLLEENDASAGGNRGNQLMAPSPVRFVTVETPMTSLSLTAASELSHIDSLQSSLHTELKTKVLGSVGGNLEGKPADETPTGPLTLTSSHYFESQASDSLMMRPLLASKEIASSLRRIAPRTTSEDTDAGMDMGDIVAHAPIRSRAKSGDSRRDEADANYDRTGISRDNDDLLVMTSEALVDLALIAFVSESDDGNRVFASLVTPSMVASVNKASRISGNESDLDSGADDDSKDRTSINEFARNLSRLAVLGFVISQGFARKPIRLTVKRGCLT